MVAWADGARNRTEIPPMWIGTPRTSVVTTSSSSQVRFVMPSLMKAIRSGESTSPSVMNTPPGASSRPSSARSSGSAASKRGPSDWKTSPGTRMTSGSSAISRSTASYS